MKVKVSPGRPDIRPVKATYVPIPTKTVSERVLPAKGVTEKGKTWGISKRSVAVKENVSLFTGKTVSAMPVRNIAKPKPLAEVRKADIRRYPPQKEIKEEPQVMPKESAGKPPIKQKETVKPLKGISERPTIMPGEGIRRTPKQKGEAVKPLQKKEGKSQPQKELKEKPKIKPLEESEGKPHTKGQTQIQEKKVKPSESQKNGEQF